MTAALYPVFLKLDGLPVVVVGGGAVAAAKLPLLLEAGARVTVIAPTIRPALRRPEVTLVEREYRDGDLEGARWVIAAATPAVNRAVSEEATRRGLFVNAVDDPEPASAYLGGVVRRGPATVAISTGGGAPALAGLLREALERVLPDELEAWLAVAQAARRDWKARGIPMAERRPLLLRALNALYDEPRPAAEQATATCGAEPALPSAEKEPS